MNKHATLVVLAAGLGSRFGGNKQISEVGPHGEILMEYSIFDAIAAGFDQVVFILKKEMIETVKEKVGNNLAKRVRVDYAVQDASSLPAWYAFPAARKKPLGTVHAVLAAKDVIQAPFVTVNADDYYGKDAFCKAYRMLGELQGAEGSMVPYVLGNTMSENGSVTRGICMIENGYLTRVDETKNIRYGEGKSIVCDAGSLDPREMVSMNFWGFAQSVLPVMQGYFEDFLRGLSPEDITKECLLPIMVNDFLKAGKIKVRAERSDDRWFGITYQADREDVQNELKALHASGAYPEKLF